MSMKPRKKRISPKESVEGPDITAQPERTNVTEGDVVPGKKRPRRAKPTFPTGAQKKRSIFARRRR